VVNEAMQFGLPAIVSDGVGCHPDLVEEGKTGYVFRSGDSAGLAQKFRVLLSLSVEARDALGTKAQELAEKCTLARAAEGLAESIFKALPGVTRQNQLVQV